MIKTNMHRVILLLCFVFTLPAFSCFSSKRPKPDSFASDFYSDIQKQQAKRQKIKMVQVHLARVNGAEDKQQSELIIQSAIADGLTVDELGGMRLLTQAKEWQDRNNMVFAQFLLNNGAGHFFVPHDLLDCALQMLTYGDSKEVIMTSTGQEIVYRILITVPQQIKYDLKQCTEWLKLHKLGNSDDCDTIAMSAHESTRNTKELLESLRMGIIKNIEKRRGVIKRALSLSMPKVLSTVISSYALPNYKALENEPIIFPHRC